MRRFIRRALDKLEKLDRESIRLLVLDIASDNERLGMVLDSMADGVVVADNQKRVLLYNKSASRLLPLRKGDLTEKIFWEVVDDAEISRFIRDKLESANLAGEKEFTLEQNGSRTVVCTLMPLVSEGDIKGSLLHIENITERRREEARFRRAESLASLTNLTASVAHEIKNPLASIAIHLQLMQKEMKGRANIETNKITEYLDVVNEEVDRLNMIIVDFLFAVRPMDTKPVLQNINTVIQDIMEFLRFELGEAGVSMTLNLGKLPKLQLDEKYIKQALLNLVKNALAAMPEGGELEIKTSIDGDNVLCQVTDSGVGIPDENMSKIFEPYFTTKDFSSGLGLTLVYKIIKEHHGEILVESRDGDGTTVTMTFPIPQGEKRLLEYRGMIDEAEYTHSG